MTRYSRWWKQSTRGPATSPAWPRLNKAGSWHLGKNRARRGLENPIAARAAGRATSFASKVHRPLRATRSALTCRGRISASVWLQTLHLKSVLATFMVPQNIRRTATGRRNPYGGRVAAHTHDSARTHPGAPEGKFASQMPQDAFSPASAYLSTPLNFFITHQKL
jgi:hypothetical protein